MDLPIYPPGYKPRGLVVVCISVEFDRFVSYTSHYLSITICLQQTENLSVQAFGSW